MFKLRSKLSINLINRFSTQKEITVPLTIYGTHGRYAKAIYLSAAKANILEKVENELASVSTLLTKNIGFKTYLGNPTIPRQEKVNRMAEIFDESKFSFVTRSLFITLAANGRAGETEEIITAFNRIMQASKGIVKVTVTTAEPLKKKQIESLQEAIVSYVGKDKEIDLNLEVKEDILGGLQVLIGDKFLDLSVINRVNYLSKELESANI